MASAALSKSQYIRGLQCHKALWLYRHRRELMAPADANRQAIFATGELVGKLAQQRFPGGSEIGSERDRLDAMCRQTRDLIDGGCDVLYEATFRSGDLLVMADILERAGGRWNYYEVKSSTRVKPYHLDDVAFQWRVMQEHIVLGKAHVAHLDNRYQLDGELDLEQLFTIVDVTERVQRMQPELEARLAAMLNMLEGAEPEIDIGMHCSNPFDCDFRARCWQSIPQPSVFNLRKMRRERKFELFHRGLVTYRDLQQVALDPAQTLQVTTALRGTTHVEREPLAEYLGGAEYPLHFLDFETLQQAVPKFQGLRPYQQIPFQYSLHILHRDGELRHREFLAEGAADPRAALATQLLDDIEAGGSIVAYSQSTEIRAIHSLAGVCGAEAPMLRAMTPRFVDLLTPFRELMVYHPDFHGNFSIKSVLPALFPDAADADYHQLEIQDGRMAMNEYARLAQLEDAGERERLRAALLAYCRLDTLAMVKIWQALQELIAAPGQ